jgi:hypothetical protein
MTDTPRHTKFPFVTRIVSNLTYDHAVVASRQWSPHLVVFYDDGTCIVHEVSQCGDPADMARDLQRRISEIKQLDTKLRHLSEPPKPAEDKKAA